EGINLIAPMKNPQRVIIPMCLAILVILYWMQHKGTHRIGQLFGPVMALWFLVLGALGLSHIIATPEVLHSLNPLHGWRLLQDHPREATGVLGSVVLAITGVEAIYADM